MCISFKFYLIYAASIMEQPLVQMNSYVLMLLWI